jgi:hypothetical protein
MAEIDPYAVLGVPRTATREEVARAYRALAKRHHPDAGAPPSPAMAGINDAWSILGSPARRTSWDAAHAVVRSPHWAAAPPRAPQRPERPAPPPPSRLDSGWAAFGVVAVVALLVGVTMIGLAAIATPAAATEAFEDEAVRFSYPVEWIVAPGVGEADGHRVVAHLLTFGVETDQLCTSFADPCTLEPEDIPAGEASIVITAWDGGTPPVPDPVINRPAGLDADAIIGGRPAAFERREIDEDTTVLWWQLSPPGFPDRWIEVTAVLRGIVLEETGVLPDIERLLNGLEFRE